MQKRFNIRVYGILINERNEILISDECRSGNFFTKFPGGGLEWGEGFKDCLKREFKEELLIDIEVGELFYLTDFFLKSAWFETDQLISIYYRVNYSKSNSLNLAPYSIPFYTLEERFRWLPLSEISEDIFTFPIDKIVGEKLRKEK